MKKKIKIIIERKIKIKVNIIETTMKIIIIKGKIEEIKLSMKDIKEKNRANLKTI